MDLLFRASNVGPANLGLDDSPAALALGGADHSITPGERCASHFVCRARASATGHNLACRFTAHAPRS